jgi:hypothetical protein
MICLRQQLHTCVGVVGWVELSYGMCDAFALLSSPQKMYLAERQKLAESFSIVKVKSPSLHLKLHKHTQQMSSSKRLPSGADAQASP